jgi:hypothetical protein
MAILVLMGQEPAWDEDPLRRSLIERAPPLTWKGILLCAFVAATGLALGLAKTGWFWDDLAIGLVVIGGIQSLRGIIRIGWLRLGGTDRPLKTYIRKRFGG